MDCISITKIVTFARRPHNQCERVEANFPSDCQWKSQFRECFVRLERLRERWKADEIGRWDLLMGDRRFRVSCGENSSNSENWTKAMSITSTAPLSSRNCPLRSSVLFSVKGGYIKAQMSHGHNREFGHYKKKTIELNGTGNLVVRGLKIDNFRWEINLWGLEANSRECIWRLKVSRRPTFDCSFVHHAGRRLRNASAKCKRW